MEATKPRCTRVERGIYRQPNGKYAVGARRGGACTFALPAPTSRRTARP
jgi:hypothetical protein